MNLAATFTEWAEELQPKKKTVGDQWKRKGRTHTLTFEGKQHQYLAQILFNDFSHTYLYCISDDKCEIRNCGVGVSVEDAKQLVMKKIQQWEQDGPGKFLERLRGRINSVQKGDFAFVTLTDDNGRVVLQGSYPIEDFHKADIDLTVGREFFVETSETCDGTVRIQLIKLEGA